MPSLTLNSTTDAAIGGVIFIATIVLHFWLQRGYKADFTETHYPKERKRK
jgi:hypothetical protein